MWSMLILIYLALKSMHFLYIGNKCYDLSFVLSKRHTLVLSNIRELGRVSSTTSYLIYKLTMVHTTLLQPYSK